LAAPVSSGDLGVDVFFSLSGFLIGLILFKELQKSDGQLSVFDFYRNRFIRIWPALFVIVALSEYFYKTNIWVKLSILTFTNNLNGPLLYLWTVAVEV
jgi:peptidoglycan/LPS O-acetylase OafA/YrhL